MMMTDTEDKTLFDELPTLRNMTNVEAANQPVEEKPKQLPDPTGYRILCAVPDVEEKFSSGLYKADVTKQYEELTTPVLFVLKLGPDAYKDERKFPTGAWCKEGDFILTRPMAGSRVKIHGREFRILNDDSVEAVVEDPRGISRA
jgi:co-chaperonin GroES (HSP10)